MLRNTLTIGRVSYELAQNSDVSTLKERAETAVRAGGRFVDVTVVGNVGVSILVSPGIPFFLTAEEVPDDPRDVGDPVSLSDTSDWELTDLLGL